MADLAFIGQGSPFLKRSQEMEDMRFLFSSPGEGGSKFFLCNHCFEGLYAKSGSFHRGHMRHGSPGLLQGKAVWGKTRPRPCLHRLV